MKIINKLAIATALLLSSAISTLAQPFVEKTAKVEAAGLYEIVFNPLENAVYVSSAGPRGEEKGKILKLDPNTLKVLSSIEAGAERPYGLGLNTKTQTLYTSNTVTGSVSAIDLITGKITVIKVEGERPHFREVVVDEADNIIYVSVATKEGSIWVIDGNTNQRVSVIPQTGQVTTGMALDKANNRLFITNMAENKVAAIDLAQSKVVEQFEAGGEGPTNLVFDAKTNRLFVANQKTNDITVLDSKTGELLKIIKTGKGALGVSFDPTHNRVYVANRGEGTVTVIDAVSYEVLANLQTGSHPNTVAVDMRSGAAFVTNKARRMPPGEIDDKGDTMSLIRS